MKILFQKLSHSKKATYVLIAMTMLLVCVYMIITHIGVRPDGDLLWHYKLGEDILKTKTLSLDNPYTFLSGTEWVPHEWLYEVCIAVILNATGAIGFCVLYALNKICLFTVTYKLNKPKSPFLFLIMFVLVNCILPMNRGNRPAEFSVYFVLCVFYFSWSNSKYKQLLYILLGVFIANFHGGVIIIMITIHFILMLLDFCMDIYNRSFHVKSYYGKHFANILLFIAACFINPAGYKLFASSFLTTKADTTYQISEWQSASFDYIFAFVIIFMVLSFGYALYKTKFDRLCVQKIGCLCALLLLSLVSLKAFIIYFIVYCVFGYTYSYQMLCDICFVIKEKWIVPEKLQAMPKLTFNMKLCLLNYVIIVFCVIAFSDVKLDIEKMGDVSSFKTWVNSFYSEEILSELQENYTDDTRILTSYSVGNVLLLNDMKCFVDTRAWCYMKELGDCDALDELFYITRVCAQDGQAITSFLNKYQFDYVWVNGELPLAVYLDGSENYELIYSNSDVLDDDVLIYERNIREYECLYKRVAE